LTELTPWDEENFKQREHQRAKIEAEGVSTSKRESIAQSVYNEQNDIDFDNQLMKQAAQSSRLGLHKNQKKTKK